MQGRGGEHQLALEWDITMVAVPPAGTGAVIMVASGAVSTAATCWLLS